AAARPGLPDRDGEDGEEALLRRARPAAGAPAARSARRSRAAAEDPDRDRRQLLQGARIDQLRRGAEFLPDVPDLLPEPSGSRAGPVHGRHVAVPAGAVARPRPGAHVPGDRRVQEGRDGLPGEPVHRPGEPEDRRMPRPPGRAREGGRAFLPETQALQRRDRSIPRRPRQVSAIHPFGSCAARSRGLPAARREPPRGGGVLRQAVPGQAGRQAGRKGPQAPGRVRPEPAEGEPQGSQEVTSRRPLTVIIPTYNEETTIADCLASVRFADEVLVVDSFSTDGTVRLAREAGARVLQHEYVYSARQKNWAIS